MAPGSRPLLLSTEILLRSSCLLSPRRATVPSTYSSLLTFFDTHRDISTPWTAAQAHRYTKPGSIQEEETVHLSFFALGDPVARAHPNHLDGSVFIHQKRRRIKRCGKPVFFREKYPIVSPVCLATPQQIELACFKSPPINPVLATTRIRDIVTPLQARND